MKATQRGKILAYCKEHGSITIRDAFEELKINSPSKRISEMRQSPDYLVESIDETRVNSDGETKRYKRYFIKAVSR
jgi:hypothetical protein